MKIAIYHTSDMHGYVFPTNYVEYQNLGMLKILSYIEKDRENYDASLLLEGGDLIQGSAMTNYLSKIKPDINPILTLLKMAKYDAYVMGNHEFNYGQDYLYKSYEQVKDLVLNSNIKGLKLGNKPYKIFDLNGFRVGVFAATTAYIPNWENAQNIEGLEFLNPVEEYGKYEREIVNNSDYVIFLYHGGFEKSLDEEFIPTEKLNGENQASEMLQRYSSINAVLSGHQHRSFITKIGDVICSQPINNARNFTKLVIDTETNSVEYNLVEVNLLDIEIDPKFSQIFDATNKKLEVYLAEVIGKLDKDIEIKDQFETRLYGHPYINLLQQIQIEVSGADFSTTTLFDTAIGFKKDISIRDVLVNYPYPNTLKVLEVSGHVIKEAIEKSATYFVIDNQGKPTVNPNYIKPKLKNYIYDFYYGLEFEADLRRPFLDRVISIKKDGKKLDLDKMYTVVLNNYRASNVNEYPCYEGAKVVKEINFDMSEIMINYFQNNKDIKVDETKNFKFIY